MTEIKPTKRTKVVREPKRARYDLKTIHAIIDEALICHVGFVAGGTPFVIPVNHWRIGESLYIHGSTASRMVRALGAGGEVCVTVTLVDGLVLGRSAFNHTMNYRSLVIVGRAEPVDDPTAKLAALEACMERIAPRRWSQVRPPSAKEMKATRVLAVPIGEASAKVNSGPPVDEVADLARPVWAGVVPLRQAAGTPQPCPRLDPRIAVPDYLRRIGGG